MVSIRPDLETVLDRDLGPFLEDWPHDPSRLNARLVEVGGGRTVVQVRVELGILQMELEGRPDGGVDRLAEVEAAIEADPDVRLNAEVVGGLRQEAVLVHQRYVALLALERYPDVIRDTARNLRVFDICRERAVEEDDRKVLEQFRPQVVATRARAEALICIKSDQVADARRILDEAVSEIRSRLEEGAVDPPECGMLLGMRDVLQPRLPVSQRHELERRIRAAIEEENYELAAILRDELRQLPG